VGLLGMIIAAEDTEALAGLFERMFGMAYLRPTASGFSLTAGLATIEVTTPMALSARLGSAMPDPAGRKQFMAALVVRTLSLEMVWAEVPEARRRARGLVVPARAACGAALIFRE
jgi:hypothetical protein